MDKRATNSRDAYYIMMRKVNAKLRAMEPHWINTGKGHEEEGLGVDYPGSL